MDLETKSNHTFIKVNLNGKRSRKSKLRKHSPYGHKHETSHEHVKHEHEHEHVKHEHEHEHVKHEHEHEHEPTCNKKACGGKSKHHVCKNEPCHKTKICSPPPCPAPCPPPCPAPCPTPSPPPCKPCHPRRKCHHKIPCHSNNQCNHHPKCSGICKDYKVKLAYKSWKDDKNEDQK